MAGYGLGALSLASGANQGLQDILAQRMLERQMALREQAAAEDRRQFDASLAQRKEESDATRILNDFYRNEAVRQRQEGIDRQTGENIVQTTPVGGSLTAQDAELLQRTGNAGVIRTIPLSGTTIEGSTPEPIRFRGYTPQESMAVEAREDAQNDRALARRESADQRAAMLKLAAGLKSSQPGMVTPSQKFQMERTLRSEWNKLTQNWRTMKGQVATMEAGLDAARRGDMAAGAQAILVTFQKILDPTSVVRESEYARSAEGQSAMNRLRGFADRMARGGVGVPFAELERFHALGKEMVAKAAAELPKVREQFDQNAIEYGLNPRLIIAEDPEESAPPTNPTTPTVVAQPDRVYYDANGNAIKR